MMSTRHAPSLTSTPHYLILSDEGEGNMEESKDLCRTMLMLARNQLSVELSVKLAEVRDDFIYSLRIYFVSPIRMQICYCHDPPSLSLSLPLSLRNTFKSPLLPSPCHSFTSGSHAVSDICRRYSGPRKEHRYLES